MKSIKAGSILPGMVLTMLTWFKPNDRRPEEVMVEHVEGFKKDLKIDLLTESGEKFTVAHNGSFVAVTPAEGPDLRVTFQIDDDKNRLFNVDAGKTVTLEDKNGETADWNTVDKNRWQLPDDECCGSTHSSSTLALQGYKVAA